MTKKSENNAEIEVKEKAKKATKEDGKAKALDLAIGQINKQLGDGAIMRLGEAKKANVELIKSGALSLDLALGGGYPKGRIIEVYGPESSGKTTLTLHAIAEVQKAGGTAAFVDAEHALDPEYARKLGVDVDNLLISQPDTGEQALAIVEALVRSSGIDLVIVDSVAALVPRAEIEGNMGDSHMGLHARLMSQALRKLAGIISKSNTTVVFINQLRSNISTNPYAGGGPAETTTGGRALKFYASVRIDIRRAEQLKQGDGEPYGAKTKVKVVKNKMAPPFKTCEFDIIFGEGISKLGIIVDMASDKNIIKKSGAWYSCGDLKLGQGKEKAKVYLEEHPAFLEEIKEKIYAAYAIDYEKKDVPDEVEVSSFEEDIENSEELLLDDLIIE